MHDISTKNSRQYPCCWCFFQQKIVNGSMMLSQVVVAFSWPANGLNPFGNLVIQGEYQWERPLDRERWKTWVGRHDTEKCGCLYPSRGGKNPMNLRRSGMVYCSGFTTWKNESATSGDLIIASIFSRVSIMFQSPNHDSLHGWPCM